MFVAYFLVFSLILVCVGFAVQVMNGVKALDDNSLDQ